MYVLLFAQVWNDVGIVRQYNSEEENSVDIEFHDTSLHHAMHITNNHNYTMASLSVEAVLLASEGDSDIPRFVLSQCDQLSSKLGRFCQKSKGLTNKFLTLIFRKHDTRAQLLKALLA